VIAIFINKLGTNETRWRLFKFRLLPTGLDFVFVIVNAVWTETLLQRLFSLYKEMLFNQHATDSTGVIGRPCASSSGLGGNFSQIHFVDIIKCGS